MRIVNIDELAQHIKIKSSTIRGLVRDKKIPYLKPTGKLLFDLDEIEQWLRTRKQKGTSKKEVANG